MPVFFDSSGTPVELGPGRGDLQYSSMPFGGGQAMIGGNMPGQISLVNKVVSYGDVFATQPLVAAAVTSMLLGAIRVPLKTYRRDDGSPIRVRPGEHPLPTALEAPIVGPGGDGGRKGYQAELVLSLLGQMEIHGSGPAKVRSGAYDALQFELVDWRTLSAARDRDGRIRGWMQHFGGHSDPVPILHDELMLPKWWSPLDELGISPLQQLGTTLKIEDAAQRHQVATLKNSARPPSAITIDKDVLPKDAAERRTALKHMRTDMTDLYVGPDNGGRPVMLPPGTDWKPVGHSAVEAELIDQRKLNRDDIIAVYHVPPPMLGILDDATLANHDAQRDMFYTDCLGGPLMLIEQAFNAHVVRDLLGLGDEYYVEFDFGAVLRGDRLKEITALRLAVSNALYTPNEARQKLNMPTVKHEDADKLFLPANNLRPLGGPYGKESPGV